MAYSNFDDVLAQLQAFGLDVEAGDVVIGERRRCRHKDGGREKRGWFQLYELAKTDGSGVLIVGSFGAFWAADNVVQKVELKKDQKQAMTAEQMAALKERIAADKRRAAAEAKRRNDRAAREAELGWRRCLPVGESAYLERKGVKPYGVRFSPKGNLVIPMLDTAGRIHGLQVIYAAKKDGRDKDFWPAGLAKKGHFFHVGGVPDSVLMVAEGYATAATLHEASGIPVAVAFDAGNLLPVALSLRKQYPKVAIVIAADDDYLRKCKHCQKYHSSSETICPHCGGEDKNRKNEGVEHAKSAALAVGGTVVIPKFADERQSEQKGPTDFNDLHALEGLQSVRAQIESHLSGNKLVSARATRAESAQPGGGDKRKRPDAQAIMSLNEIVERYVPLDDGTGDYVFDTWTNKVAKKSQMLALLPAGVRGDDIKRNAYWVERGAYYLDQVGFDPSGNDENVKLNTWQGWPMKPAAGKCDLLLDLVSYLCGKEQNGFEVTEWLLDWMAYPLQNPGAKMASAVIMHGPQGTGKSTIFQTIAKIYGDYATVLNQRGLEDKFNSDWSDSKLFILAEEVVTRAEMWHIKNELKELVTGEWIRINPKNVAAYRQRNQVNIAYLSNENQPLPLDNDDRRHLVIYTPPALSESFYDEVNIELENGGVAAFYDFLLRRDLSRFHPKKRPPMTEAKKNLIALSQASEIRFINDWITGDAGLPICPCISGDLYAAYLRWCRLNGESRPRPSNQFFGQIQHMQGWEKTKAKLYEAECSTKATAKPVVIPPQHILESNDATQPAGKSPPIWLGECARRFKDAINGENNYERSAA